MNMVAREVHGGFKWQITSEHSGIIASNASYFLRVVHRSCVVLRSCVEPVDQGGPVPGHVPS